MSMSRTLSALASFLLFSFAMGSTTPPPSSTLACRRLMDGVSAFGHNCKTNDDCTKLTCTLQNFLTYSIALEKCTRPVKVFLSVSIPSLGYSDSHTFEGEQRIKLPNMPSILQLVIGQPYVNVEAKRAPGGGITLSAGVWLKTVLGGWKRYSLFDKETIPVDTSTCATIQSDIVPSQYTDYHDYDYDGSISDELKNLLGLYQSYLGGGNGGKPTTKPSPFPSSSSSPSSLDSLKKSVNMWLSKGGRSCVIDGLQKVYSLTMNQINQPDFVLRQERKLNRFNEVVEKCVSKGDPVPSAQPAHGPSLFSTCLHMMDNGPTGYPFENPDYDGGIDMYYELMKKCKQTYPWFGQSLLGKPTTRPSTSKGDHMDAIIIASSVTGSVIIVVVFIIVLLFIRNKRHSSSEGSGQIAYGQLNDEA